jgi:hypothetical protein
MRQRLNKVCSSLIGCALLFCGGSLSAQDGCPSLSGCPYQAGRGLPGRETGPREAPAAEPRPPVILNSCDAGGCTDPTGTRYNGRSSESENGVYLDPQGRRCVRSGDQLQCG